MKRPFVPEARFFKGSYNPEYENQIIMCKNKCFEYNHTLPSDTQKLKSILRDIIGEEADKEPIITPPFQCDYGYNLRFGKNFYSNHNLVINDGLPVTFGDNVFIAPNCTFTTAEHAIDPEMRKEGIEIAKPITVGNNVWIGAGSIVLAGVTIGDNTVIGAGSVVTKPIPANVVAVGVPCRVKRPICEDDKTTYPFYKPE